MLPMHTEAEFYGSSFCKKKDISKENTEYECRVCVFLIHRAVLTQDTKMQPASVWGPAGPECAGSGLTIIPSLWSLCFMAGMLLQ